MRNAFMAEGALLLEFDLLPSTTGVASGDIVSAWRRIEKFGFLVTKDTGCMIPHAQFLPHTGNSKLGLAHICAMAFFQGQRINYENEKGKTNADGWPVDAQISHLCHTSGCCNPRHLVVEQRWKNVKRNYCGFKDDADDGEQQASCNCGMTPPCVRKYFPSSVIQKRPLLVDNEPGLGRALRHFVGGLKPGQDAAVADATKLPTCVPFSVRVLPADYYVNEDQKKKNRLLRRKREEKHDAQTAKNKARKAAAQGAGKKTEK